MGDVLSESITLRVAPQPTLGTDPTAGWATLQIDKGSLQNWKRMNVTVERSIHSKFMVPRKGDVIGWTVSPSFDHDCNKDFMDLFAEPSMRCVASHPGGKGQRVYRPTAVVDGGASEDSYTVAALGDLPANVLIYARGFDESGNNGLKTTVSGSTATEIKVATGSLTAEADAPDNATVDVVGFVGASGDIAFDASGNLTSTLLDFTTLGLKKGMRLVIGGEATGTRFATAANNCLAYIASTPTANLIELENHVHDIDTAWTPTADAGAGKTIQIFVDSLYRNYAIDDALYSKKLVYGELEEPLAGSDSSTRWTYCKGLAVNTLTIAAPLRSKITATVAMIGTDATKPLAAADRLPAGASAGAGPANAYEPLATALVDTQNDLDFIRLCDSSGTLVGEINSWTLTLGNNVSPKEVQGTPGAIGHHYGEFTHSVQLEAYYTDSDQVAAATENRDLFFDAFVRNDEFAFTVRLPKVAMRNDNKTYAANTQVTLSFDAPAFGDDDSNLAASLGIYGYVPPLAGPQ